MNRPSVLNVNLQSSLKGSNYCCSPSPDKLRMNPGDAFKKHLKWLLLPHMLQLNRAASLACLVSISLKDILTNKKAGIGVRLCGPYLADATQSEVSRSFQCSQILASLCMCFQCAACGKPQTGIPQRGVPSELLYFELPPPTCLALQADEKHEVPVSATGNRKNKAIWRSLSPPFFWDTLFGWFKGNRKSKKDSY